MGQLVKFLHNWKCNPQLSLFGCMITLAKDMVLNKFWLKRDANVIRAWVVDLTVLCLKTDDRLFTRLTGSVLPTRTEHVDFLKYVNDG